MLIGQLSGPFHFRLTIDKCYQLLVVQIIFNELRTSESLYISFEYLRGIIQKPYWDWIY